MEYFDKAGLGRTVVLRLDPGDYVLESIQRAADGLNIKDGYIATAIGTLDYCVLHMVTTTTNPPVATYPKWENTPLELVSVTGIIANGTPHLHATVSDKQVACAGHLEPGCRILYLGEVVIQELTGQALERIRNANNVLELREKRG